MFIKLKNETLLESALTHPSYNQKRGAGGFERLAFLGSQILDLVLSEELIRRYPNESRTGFIKKLEKLMYKDVRRAVFISLEGEKYLKADPIEIKMLTSFVFAEACEAIIGALYLDQGLRETSRFILKHWEFYLDGKINASQDYKERLDQWVQKGYKELPIYKVISNSEIDAKSLMAVELTIPQRKPVIGFGPSPNLAKKSAALCMLRELDLL